VRQGRPAFGVLWRAQTDARPADGRLRPPCGALIALRNVNGQRPANRRCGNRIVQQPRVRINAPILRGPDEHIHPRPPRCGNQWGAGSFPVGDHHHTAVGGDGVLRHGQTGHPTLTFLVRDGAFGALAFLAHLRRSARPDELVDQPQRNAVRGSGQRGVHREPLMRGMVEIAQTGRRRMPGTIQFGGILNDQHGGLRRDPRQGGALMRGANRLRGDGWGGEEALGGFGRRPGTARRRDTRGWLRDQAVNHTKQSVAQACIPYGDRLKFGRSP